MEGKEPTKISTEKQEGARGFCVRAGGLVWHNLFQTWTQIKRHKASYALGFLACLVVVVVVACLLTVIGNAPVVYLRIAELDTSEIDISLSADTESSTGRLPYLNYTQIAEILSEERLSYHSTRWTFSASPVHRCSSRFVADLASSQGARWMYHGFPSSSSDASAADASSQTAGGGGTGDEACDPTSCFDKYCEEAELTTTDVIAADSAREARMLLGRTWDLPALGPDEAHVSRELASKLGVVPGDIVVIELRPSDMFGSLWSHAHSSSSPRTTPNWRSSKLFVPVKIAGVYQSSMGRVPSNLHIGLILEYGPLGSLLSRCSDPDDQRARQFFSTTNMSEYAQNVLVNLPPPRAQPYIQSNLDTVRRTITQFASEVIYRTGFNNLEVDLPVMETLYPYRFVALFLGLIINLSIIVLLFLCIILIYSLLMINVETRTFEVGVFRMIGTSRLGLIALLLTQALAYAVPSWAIGLAFAQVLAVAVFQVIESVASVPIPNLLTGQAIGVATGLGFLIPILSSILPIRSALRLNLSESLDTRRSKVQAVKIEVERSEQTKVSWTALAVGLFLAAFGFGVYYIFPVSLLSFNFELLLNLFFILILLMLVGFVMLSLNVENIMHRGLTWLFFFWDKVAIRKILLKNLIAHRVRNRKTTIMYSVSLSFVIFLYVAYAMQMKSFQYQLKQQYGTELGLAASGKRADGSPYTITTVTQLEGFARNEPLIADFSWSTVDLSLLTGSAYRASNLGRLFENTINIYGVSPNFFDISFPDFLKIDSRSINETIPENVSVSEQLYTVQGSKGLVVGTLFKKTLGIGLDDHFLVNEYIGSASSGDTMSLFGSGTDYSTAETPQPVRKKSFVFLSVAPASTFSKFPSVSTQDALVSFPQYIALSRGKVTSMDNIPLGVFHMKLADGVNDTEYRRIKQNLVDISAEERDRPTEVWDLRQQFTSMDVASKITNYFFLFTTVVAMVTSFFSLSSSMLANVYEQTKEIGVLRALGVTRPYMYRIYVFEAFLIVFGSSLMGIIIGTIIGWTMTLQRVLFTQLPLGFVFPWEILLLVFGLSVLFALLSSFGPIRAVMGKSIVQIMRMLS